MAELRDDGIRPASIDPASLGSGEWAADLAVPSVLEGVDPAERETQDLLTRLREGDPDALETVRRYLMLRGFAFSRTRVAYGFTVMSRAYQLLDFNPLRLRATIFNNSGQTVYWGGDNQLQTAIGAKAGMPLPTGQALSLLPDEAPPPLWMICASDGADVRVSETIVEHPAALVIARLFPPEARDGILGG